MTPSFMQALIGCPAAVAEAWAPALTEAMPEFDIETPERQAAFLAQCAHESMLFTHPREIWGPTSWQAGYWKRADLGNTRPEAVAYAAAAGINVGRFYAGEGPIQLTGYDNVSRASQALFGDDRLAREPRQLEQPLVGSRSACWFWKTHGLNELADADEERSFDLITHRINPGMLGADARRALWHRIRRGVGLE